MLTDTTIRKAKGTDKPRKLTDGAGLYLLVNPNGSRWWRFDYRFAGKRKTLSMGTYPATSLTEARERRDHARKLLAKGTDPGEHRKARAGKPGKGKATTTATGVVGKTDTTLSMSARANASRPLAALGISEVEEHVYRALLKHRLATAKDIGGTLSLPSSQVQRLLDGLRDKGLATATLERTPRYTAPPPELAIRALAGRRLADIERSQLIIPELSECADSTEDHKHEQVVELITDQAILRQTVVQMQQLAEHELIGFQIAPVLFSVAYESYLKKSVHARCVSDSSYVDLPGGSESIKMAMQAGEEHRICSKLPVKLLIVDRRMGLIPLNSKDPSGPTLLVRPCALLDALCSLFELHWKYATPMATAPTETLVTAHAASGLSEAALNLVPLLAAGLNDKAIILETGMSKATLSRRITELMRHFDTRTRFQLGWRAAVEAFPSGLPRTGDLAGPAPKPG